MARSTFNTWLTLDEWARIFKYNKWHFNGFSGFPCQDGYPCKRVWTQCVETADGLSSRDELALAINQAETELAEYVGFNLLPSWDFTVTNTIANYDPTAPRTPYNARGRPKSVQVSHRLLRALGRRATTTVQASADIVRIDDDGDGFDELATVAVDTSSITDKNEVRVYYPGHAGESAWEIRPLDSVTDSEITFHMSLAAKEEAVECGNCFDPLDPEDTTNFLTTVDVVRVYTDTTTPINLVYQPDVYCETTDFSQQYSPSAGYIDDFRLGYVVYNPLGYNEPENVEIHYYSGFVGSGGRLNRALVELDYTWKLAVAYFAAGLLDNPAPTCCEGESEGDLVSRWSENISKRTQTEMYSLTNNMLENPLGLMTRGAWYALKIANMYKIG